MLDFKIIILFALLEIFLIVLALEIHGLLRRHRLRKNIKQITESYSEESEETFIVKDGKKYIIQFNNEDSEDDDDE